MNALQKAYCDGASMAYRDTANIIRDLIRKAPPMIKDLVEATEPLARACERKALEVYQEAERFDQSLQGKHDA